MKRATIKKFRENDYATAEALNTICSNLIFAGPEYKKILVTSCTAGEGKSYMTMQMMRNLTGRGLRVLVIDADLRRSMLTSTYGIAMEGDNYGLAHYLAGYCVLDEAIYETNVGDACIMPAGRTVANPIPLVTSQRFHDMLDELADQFDYVIVDTPPVGLVVDAAEIARFCHGTLFVVRYNKTPRRDLQQAKQQIQRSGCPILGCIINQVDFSSVSSKNYYNKSHYDAYTSNYTVRKNKSPDRLK